MSEQIVLFDLASKEPRSCWSLNPWKTRMLLNYKGLDYRTEWVEYPDIQPTLSPHLPPNGIDVPYTIPTIRLPSGTYVTDSRKIAAALEEAHPSPPIHLDSPTLAKLEDLMRRIMVALQPVYIPLVPKRLLNEASLPHWHSTRPRWVGTSSIDEYERMNPASEAWDRAENFLKEVTGLLKAQADGPCFLGREVSYADFVWAGFLIFLRRMGEDVLEEGLRRSGDKEVHEALLKGLEPWTKRCDY
ncbi:hypothetical protein N657DRAFT_640345 [Parathielavia appendiculata]|uniref:GST N-terminal domain-containing protein n=1 Tax=Parathielavia appendiculata TaxID=2587402 RepID=A0AAN6UBE8_9PEZI|nr:hypothetical protein N657DRAFT_640345 [Parathielavia appendiculata]